LPGDSPIPEGPEETLPITSFAPPVDIYEDEHTIALKLEVPRIDEKEIDVRIESNTLAGSITAGSITKGHDTVNVAFRCSAVRSWDSRSRAAPTISLALERCRTFSP
jgi:HSP20 family molecular chaperone IbpA